MPTKSLRPTIAVDTVERHLNTIETWIHHLYDYMPACPERTALGRALNSCRRLRLKLSGAETRAHAQRADERE